MRRFGWSAVLAMSYASTAIAQSGVAPVDPRLVDGRLVYPEGAAIPRYQTEIERRFGGIPAPDLRGTTPPPAGPIRCPGEYEPMDGILIAWEGSASWLSILAQMAARITTTGNADVYVAVDTVAEQTSASTSIAGQGANMSRVKFVVRATDTIWIRDYGPRYIYEGSVRAIVDHVYNRPRPSDDVYPGFFATVKHHAFYELPLVHGGGNYHLSGLGDSYCTRLINNENPGLTEAQIHDIWQDYQNVNTTFFTPFPTSVDATQHIDMWVQVTGDRSVMISDWPNNVGSTQDVICDNAAANMAANGYTVARVPARSIGGVHYTYTNVVMCNDIVLLPTYSNATVVAAGHNAQALTAWQTALPGKTILQINCEAIVSAAGVMHCIAMHMPAHLGGQNPTAFLRTLRGGEVLTPGAAAEIRWSSDDDIAVVDVDVLLSTDGGANYDQVLAANTADDGLFAWTVPDVYSDEARIRVVTRDAGGRTGFDESPANFTINGTQFVVGDMNCDGVVSVGDIAGFVLALTDPSGYAATYPGCNIANADVNGDTVVSVGDIGAFVTLLAGG